MTYTGHVRQSVSEQTAGRSASVQQGESGEVLAGQAPRASVEHPLMAQQGINERSRRIPAIPTLSTVMARRMQWSRWISESVYDRWPESRRIGRISPSRSYNRSVGTDTPSIKAASPMVYVRFSSFWGERISGLEWQKNCIHKYRFHATGKGRFSLRKGDIKKGSSQSWEFRASRGTGCFTS
jgi:hypothetical protein